MFSNHIANRVAIDRDVVTSNRFDQVCYFLVYIWQLYSFKLTICLFDVFKENSLSFQNILHELWKLNLSFGVELALVPYLLEGVLVKRTLIESRDHSTKLFFGKVIFGRKTKLSDNVLYLVCANMLIVVCHKKF